MTGKSIVLGLDRSPGADRALAIAIELAASFDVPLVLVHGVAPARRRRARRPARPRGPDRVGRVHRRPRGRRGRGGRGAHVVSVVDERPAQALVDAADEHDALVIVVGTWNESPLRGALLGSVAHKLLQLSTRPVLCVPRGGS